MHILNYKKFKESTNWGVIIKNIHLCHNCMLSMIVASSGGKSLNKFFFNPVKPTRFYKSHVQLDLTLQKRKCRVLSPQALLLTMAVWELLGITDYIPLGIK